jgi:hypothetical protein
MKNKRKSMKTSVDMAFYRRYSAMKYRCENKNDSSYSFYGGRGIKNKWKTFKDFKEDMIISFLEHVKKYGLQNTTLDRINSNKNYCKDNCRWATRKIQALNTRRTHLIKYNNQIDSIYGWSVKMGIGKDTLKRRLYDYGWSVKKSLNTASPGLTRGANGRFIIK